MIYSLSLLKYCIVTILPLLLMMMKMDAAADDDDEEGDDDDEKFYSMINRISIKVHNFPDESKLTTTVFIIPNSTQQLKKKQF